MKKLLVFALGISLFSCSKDEAPGNNQPVEEALSFVKTGANGDIILDENIYQADGKIKTRIGYKDHSLGIVSSKSDYSYENGRLMQTESQMDLSSSTSATQYSYSKSDFEYNNSGLVTQRNHYRKENDQYELISFSVFTYNNEQLPVRENRYMPDGTLYGYSTYVYNSDGNVTELKNYSVTGPGSAHALTLKQSFKYDAKNNPYTRVYHLTENIPFSVNHNNITETTTVNYAINAQGISSTSTTSYQSYNNNGFPTNMNENGNIFILQYK